MLLRGDGLCLPRAECKRHASQVRVQDQEFGRLGASWWAADESQTQPDSRTRREDRPSCKEAKKSTRVGVQQVPLGVGRRALASAFPLGQRRTQSARRRKAHASAFSGGHHAHYCTRERRWLLRLLSTHCWASDSGDDPMLLCEAGFGGFGSFYLGCWQDY